LANTGNRPVTVEAMFSAGSTLFGFPRGPNKLTRSERWDPLTGAIEPLPQGGSSVPLSFEPSGSQMGVFRTDDAGEESRPTSRRVIEAIALGSGWKVSVNGKSTENVSVPHSWTESDETRFISGTGSYVRSVEVPVSYRASSVRVFLDFGPGTAIERPALPGGTLRGNS